MPKVAPPPAPWRNWAGNQRAVPAAVARPRSTAEVADLIRTAAAAGQVVKAVGAGHSFTGIATTSGVRVELAHLSSLRSVDRDARLVRVGAGMTLRALNDALAGHGLALPNLGDIDAQTVAGALATGTHGTGARFGCLSTLVSSMELVTGTGAVVECSATSHPDIFAAARVGLGALGIATEVTLRCEDAFTLRADERPAPVASVLIGLDQYAADNDHVEFYWLPYTDAALLKRNNRVAADDRPESRIRGWWEDDFLQNTVFGGVCRAARAFPSRTPFLLRTTARFFSPREYTSRSDRVFTTPRRVRFVEMEYALPRAALPEAFAALRSIVATLPYHVVLPVEVRVTAADDIWLSHSYGRDSAYIAIHQFVGMPYEAYFRAFEAACVPLGGRPHWGKLHYRDASSLAGSYPRFADFLAVRDQLDPGRVFANPYLTEVLGP